MSSGSRSLSSTNRSSCSSLYLSFPRFGFHPSCSTSSSAILVDGLSRTMLLLITSERTVPGELRPSPGSKPSVPKLRPSPGSKPSVPELRPSPGCKPSVPELQPSPGSKLSVPELRPSPVSKPSVPEIRSRLFSSEDTPVLTIESEN